MAQDLHWWQKSVIYQIVVPSFQDLDDDGVGDLNGVTKRLDYLQWLGVGAIWLTPMYPSPMEDLGYDVSDFTEVNPQFGSLENFDRLVAAVHRRGMKILLDWVPSHTSDQHPWFVQSRSSRDNPMRNWYLWHDGKHKGEKSRPQPPTNWLSVFGGSAWQWDEQTEQFYYHSFLESQPDLNWRNPEVSSAVNDAMKFWLERGVDGFRVDAVSWMIKDEQWRDNPPNPNYRPEKDGPDQEVVPVYTWGLPEVHEIVAGMRRVVDAYDDRVLAGELVLPIEKIVTYYGDEQHPELHLPLNLHLEWVEWTAEEVGQVIETYERHRPPHGWPTWTISTHDFPRTAFRLKGDQNRVAAMLLLAIGGTPTLYYGEEIGMKGVQIPPSEARDPQGRRIGRNRDPQRTPMQWDESPGAGFTRGAPWLPIGEDVATANVATQSGDPKSVLALYRRLIALRNQHRVLQYGQLETVSRKSPLLILRRISREGQLLIALNLTGKPCKLPSGERSGATILLSTFLDREGETAHQDVHMRGNEGLIISVG